MSTVKKVRDLVYWKTKFQEANQNGAVRKETPKGWMYISTPAEIEDFVCKNAKKGKLLTTKIIADIVTFLGMLIMIWARKTLDRNWSANIVLKKEHELITSGPYAFVRHPIYTGLSLMILGVVIYINTLAFTIFFVLFFFGAYYKAKKEERLLINHFADKYLEYKKKTKALIPFIF